MKNEIFIPICLLIAMVFYLGHQNISYKAKLNDLTNFNDSLIGKYQIKKDIALKQFKLINQLDSIKTNCKRCNIVPVYETRF